MLTDSLPAIGRAMGDLADRGVLAVLWRSLLVTIAIFAVAGAALGWALGGSDPCGLIGESCLLSAGEGGFGAFLLTLLAVWLLFPAVAVGVIAAFSDRIVAAVERRHYPEAAAIARPVGAGAAALLGLRSAGRVIFYNLLALPFYILLLVTGIGPVLLFVAVNGVALGRDFGEMVALRHGDRAARREWLRASRGPRALIGGVASGLFLIPFLNLLAPVIGAAAATHLFHGRAPK